MLKVRLAPPRSRLPAIVACVAEELLVTLPPSVRMPAPVVTMPPLAKVSEPRVWLLPARLKVPVPVTDESERFVAALEDVGAAELQRALLDVDVAGVGRGAVTRDDRRAGRGLRHRAHR